MTPSSPEYIAIDEASKRYSTSRRTIERRRERAREKGDRDTLDAFLIKTDDGHEYPAPTESLAASLRKDGRNPKTFIATEWLDKTFRHDPSDSAAPKRHTATPDGRGVTHNDAPQDDSTEQRLWQQLEAKDQQLHEKDEQLKRKDDLIQNLSLALRSSSEAYKQLGEKVARLPPTIAAPVHTTSSKSTPKQKPKPSQSQKSAPVDTTPKPELVKQKPRNKPKTKAAQQKKEPAAAKQGSDDSPPERRGLFSWFR